MRKVVLSFVFVMASLMVFSQKRYSYGFTVGSGVSFLTGSNSGLYVSSAPKVDITAGINGDVRVWKSFYLQAEIDYQNIGGGKETNNVIPIPMGGYDKYTFQYISIPVMLKFKIPETGFGFYAGLQNSFLLSGKVRTGATVPAFPNSSPNEEPNSSYKAGNLSNRDFSGIAGIENYWHIKSGNQIGFSIRYQWSLNSIDNDSNTATTLKSNVFLLSLGYRFK
ncbi:MAG: outer membrane beta-barrel protein [Puia sp.]|nr:outer membrane beta-barrel protein [Puia sp.]